LTQDSPKALVSAKAALTPCFVELNNRDVMPFDTTPKLCCLGQTNDDVAIPEWRHMIDQIDYTVL
jgi:hypothetical protein